MSGAARSPYTLRHGRSLRAHPAALDGGLNDLAQSSTVTSRYLDTPFFRPEASGLGQSDGRKAVERFIDRFNVTGSLRPSHYSDVSRNASYLIGLILHARADGALD